VLEHLIARLLEWRGRRDLLATISTVGHALSLAKDCVS
jgi:hypothetical protein